MEELFEIIALDLRHEAYDRTLEIRRFCHMVTTGKNQDSVVENFRRFETDSMKEQRKRLYVPITSYAISRPRKYFKRLLRLEGVRADFETNSKSVSEEIGDMFHEFMPGETLDMWLLRNLERLTVIDPNAYIVFERADQRDVFGEITKTTVYPVIFNSEQVVWKTEKMGRLTSLCGRTMKIERTVKAGVVNERVLHTYWLYTPGRVIRAREVGDSTIKEVAENEAEISTLGGATKKFYVLEANNGTKEVPAICAGAYFDEECDSGAFVSWFYPAKDLFLDLIRMKSSKDLTVAIHTYRKRWEIVKPCKFQSEKGSCDHGYINGIRSRQNICPECEGTGMEPTFTTEQESIRLTMPTRMDDLIDLSKLSYIEPTDLSLPEFQSKEIENLVSAIMATVFDTGLYQAPTTTETRTATEVDAVMDGVDDVLQPFCDLYSRAWELAYRCAFDYMEVDGKANHAFPEDKVIQTLLELLQEVKKMQEAGADFETIRKKQRQIHQKVADGDPDEMRKLEVKAYWLPFADKTQEVAYGIVQTRAANDPDRVLFENFVDAFKIIDEKHPDFYNSEYNKQAEIMALVIAEITARVQVESVTPTFQ